MRHRSQGRERPRRQTWLRLCMTAVMAVMMLGTFTAAYAAVTLPPDALYSRTRLGEGSQGFGLPGFAWQNVVPNALASYFTYVPYSTADAVKLGFPATCGAAGAGGEDCYTITAKRFPQQLALPGIFGGGAGLKDELGNYYGPANPLLAHQSYTDVYGYGSGGVGWVPPQFVNNGTVNAPNIQPVAAPVSVTGNAPAVFTNGTYGTTGIWHFPAPTIKGTFGRPIRVQWLNELPNTIIPGFDPTVDCSNSTPNCFPYNRIVTHVHGAHVGPASDGLAHASFNPDFSAVGTKFNQSVLPPAAGPPGTYVYPMDQEASTIWYHDHAVGATHTNTNQGMAGFFPITDSNEQCLQGIGGAGCATKYLPTGDYELGFALQDRIFYTDGMFAMPDAPVIDANFPTCNPTTPASRLSTCAPLFMYASHAANAASKTPAGVHLVPYNGLAIENIPENAQAPVLATSATLEFFGNMPVVNGVVYGKYDVEPRVYRIRLLGGTDSRTWVMQLQRRDTSAIIPFWMIGSEQGLLNNPVSMTEAHLMPGERLDMLVDFTGIPVGTKIVLNNLGPDTPYQGEPLATMVRSVDIPEIMEFNTIAFNNAVADVPTPSAATNLRPLNGAIVPLTATTGVPVRVVALEEIVDEFGRVMPTIDRRGYDLPLIPATEIIKVSDTEIWDIINTTADAHTMHLHQVKFQVVHRQPYLTFTPAVNDTVNGVFSPASYTAAPGSAVPVAARDAGWKDTDEMIPGTVTRIIATFDLVGEYVWHCHILSHEEHDMMRPMIIAATAASPPVSLTVPPTASNVNRTATVTIAASPTPGVNHIVEYKLLTDPNWTTNISTGLTPTITFPADGVYELRAKAIDAALTPTLANSAYVAGSNTITVSQIAPASPTVLTANSTLPSQVALSWTDNAVNELGVQIQRATDIAFTAGLTTVYRYVVNLTTYTDTTVAPGTTYFYRVRSLNAAAYSPAFSNTATVTTPAFGITTTSLAAGSVNGVYIQPVTASGGVMPYSWSATGLPAGLAIDPATGVISGTPAPGNVPTGASAIFPVSITVQDSAAVPATSNTILNLAVLQSAPSSPTVLTANSTLPSQVALAWTDNANNEAGVQIQRATDIAFTVGLTTVYRYGVNLTTYTDTTAAPGTPYFYRVRSLNAARYSLSFSNTATVTTPAFGITTTSLAAGSVNGAYSQPVTASGGVLPFSWSATGLPTGLSIDLATGVISGTPAPGNVPGVSAVFPVSITVQDSAAVPATSNTTLNLTVRQSAPSSPTVLTANATVPNQVALAWTDNANNEVGVQIQRATDIAFTVGLTTVYRYGVNLTTYTDTTVAPATPYFYRVRSLNAATYSPSFSNTVTATTL